MRDTLQNKKRKNIIRTGIFLLLITPVIIFILVNKEQKPDPASEQAFRKAAARQLHIKDPNKLSDEDIASMTTLLLLGGELCDIQPAKKFANLQTLVFDRVKFPDKAIPAWMRVLGKCGIIDIKKRAALDLGPIEQFENIRAIGFLSTPVKSFRPLLKLKNLESLDIDDMAVPDFKSLKKLKNVKTLNLYNNPNITDEQIEELKEALPGVEITRKSPYKGMIDYAYPPPYYQ